MRHRTQFPVIQTHNCEFHMKLDFQTEDSETGSEYMMTDSTYFTDRIS